MDRRRLPDLSEQRRPGRRPSYGYVRNERRRSTGQAILFGVVILVPALLLAGLAMRVFGGGGDGDTARAAATSDTGSIAEVEATATATSAGATPTPTAPPRSVAIPGITLPTAPPPTALAVPPPEINAAAAIVMDGDSMAVLYERNAHERRQPASLTKMVTAIVTAEHANLEDIANSDAHHWDLFDSTNMGLVPGDEFTIRNLLYGLMLVSGNDAAQVIARHVAGSEEAFVVAMNLLIERLQLKNTQFKNVHGLTDEGQYSTAYDLALIARHLMEYEALREIVGTEQITVSGTRDGQPLEIFLYNQNPLLNYTPGVDGVKTGFTEEAGRTFAASVLRDGHRIYLVLLDARNRAEDAIALIEWAYAAHEWKEE